MSASSQNNGKKSSNSSVVNTPASTPITNISNGNPQSNSQSSPPPNNNAPKYGTLVPNRIFVGGISANTTEGELLQLFSSYGTVKAAKIIQDRAGVSKGYGFITFENEDDAKRPLREAENIVLRERKLNIAPAIKKQPFSRAFDASSPPTVAPGNPPQFFFPTSMPYFQGGVTYYHQPPPTAPGDPNTQQPTVYQPPPVYPAQTGPPQTATYPSMMFPAQPIYMPQQFPMAMPFDYNYYQTNGGQPQYMVGGQGGPGPQCPPMPPSNSPPRPPCYNQQMPYGPTDQVFYNMSVYGTTMEGAPIYSEGLDIATGPYGEDAFNMVDGTSQDIEHSNAPLMLEGDHHPALAQQPPPTLPPQASEHPPQKPSPHATSHQQAPPHSEPEAGQRQCQTPVVSLLSIEQQQEKDYMSMQGGRRRKSNPMPPPQPHAYHHQPNGYVNSFAYPSNYHHQPAPSLYNPYNGVANHYSGPVVHHHYGQHKTMNGGMVDRTKKTRSFNNRNRNNDHSSRSSIRTDSNSSASIVDENKNEDKSLRTNVHTPPPAAYSPMANHQFTKYGPRNFQSTVRPHRNNYTTPNERRNNNSTNNSRHHTTNYSSKLNNNNNNVPGVPMTSSTATVTTTQNKRLDNSNNNNNTSADVSTTNKSREQCGDFNNTKPVVNNFVPPPPVSQVHAAGGGSNQNFVPPARRSRRSIRRGTPSGVGEIGAGDAPLPNSGDVGDACKKMESLKL